MLAPVSETRPVICHVIHALGVGGAEVLVDAMMRRMSDNFQCIVAVLDDVGEIGQKLQDDGFVVEHLNRQAGIDRACAKRLHQFAETHNAALFHAHQYTPFFQAMLSRGLTGRRPVLLTEHGRHFPDIPSRKRSIVNRILLKKCDRLVGVGGNVRQALIDNEGLPKSRVEVVYNGIDLQQLSQPSPGARQKIRTEFGLFADDFVAVQVARLHDLKDHLTAVKAMKHAVKACPNLKLLIIGEGETRPAIEAAVREHQLQQNVVLTGSRNDVADLLAAADAFLMTSISEGIPLTIIEAMAARLPIVSTAVGGIPEMIQHDQNGLLAPARDDLAVSAALISLQQNPSLAGRLANAGRETAEQRFSQQSMLATYARMYQDMLT